MEREGDKGKKGAGQRNRSVVLENECESSEEISTEEVSECAAVAMWCGIDSDLYCYK